EVPGCPDTVRKVWVLARGLVFTSPGFWRGRVNCLCCFGSLQRWVRKEERFRIHGPSDNFTGPFAVRKYSDQKQLG
ncbi:mCG1042667, partial [Mus musculus]